MSTRLLQSLWAPFRLRQQQTVKDRIVVVVVAGDKLEDKGNLVGPEREGVRIDLCQFDRRTSAGQQSLHDRPTQWVRAAGLGVSCRLPNAPKPAQRTHLRRNTVVPALDLGAIYVVQRMPFSRHVATTGLAPTKVAA